MVVKFFWGDGVLFFDQFIAVDDKTTGLSLILLLFVIVVNLIKLLQIYLSFILDLKNT